MAEEKTNSKAHIKKFFNRFFTSQKVITGSIVLLCIMFIIMIINLTSAIWVRVEKFFTTSPGIGLVFLVIILIILLFRKRLFKGNDEISMEVRVDSKKLTALQEAKDEAEIERELLEKYNKIPWSLKKIGIIRDKIKRFASENKDEAARLVKSFLIEDER
jgi:amino acid permease